MMRWMMGGANSGKYNREKYNSRKTKDTRCSREVRRFALVFSRRDGYAKAQANPPFKSDAFFNPFAVPRPKDEGKLPILRG